MVQTKSALLAADQGCTLTVVEGTTIRKVSWQQATEEVKLLEGATMDDRGLTRKL